MRPSRRDVLRWSAQTGAAIAAGPQLLALVARATRGRPWQPASVSVPDIITRAEWGADESLRSGTPEFATIRKLVVHHTVTTNDDPDPAATVRAIYQSHTQQNGWNDIGYNFLVDAQGRVYEGRWARGYESNELHSGEATDGRGVIGAHDLNYNTGSCGVALLGTFDDTVPTPAAIDALVRVLAWKASVHTIDPLGASAFTNGSGSTTSFPNISGHRDTNATDCPGQKLYPQLPNVRTRVAGALGTGLIGYRVALDDGTIVNFGGAYSIGDVPSAGVHTTARGIASTASGLGAWVVATDGGIFSFGDARFYGSMGATHLSKPVIGMAATPSGAGYWLVGGDGGIFSFGDAQFFGSTGNRRLNRPVVGLAPTPTGSGYWLVAEDGGIFSFGDAQFFGSTGGIRLNRPIVGMTATHTGKGYWLLADDGGVFCFGDAAYYGSVPSVQPSNAVPAVQLAATPTGSGYMILTRDGGVYCFGDCPFYGSAAGRGKPAVGLVTINRG